MTGPQHHRESHGSPASETHQELCFLGRALWARSKPGVLHPLALGHVLACDSMLQIPTTRKLLERNKQFWKVKVASPSCAFPQTQPHWLGPHGHPSSHRHGNSYIPVKIRCSLEPAASFAPWPCGAPKHQEGHRDARAWPCHGHGLTSPCQDAKHQQPPWQRKVLEEKLWQFPESTATLC